MNKNCFCARIFIIAWLDYRRKSKSFVSCVTRSRSKKSIVHVCLILSALKLVELFLLTLTAKLFSINDSAIDKHFMTFLFSSAPLPSLVANSRSQVSTFYTRPISKQITTFPNKNVDRGKKSEKLYMIWSYPLYGDDPKKKRRKKIDPSWELGENRMKTSFNFEYANAYAQNCYFIPGKGRIVKFEENGLGRTDDMYITAKCAAGGVDIDPVEVAKIRNVLPTFDQGNGLGVATLIGAKRGAFAFKYNGPLSHKLGIKAWLKYMINYWYPGARVSIVAEHWKDVDEVTSHEKHIIPYTLTSYHRKKVTWRYPYAYENEEKIDGPNVVGADYELQMLP